MRNSDLVPVLLVVVSCSVLITFIAADLVTLMTAGWI